MQRLERGRRSAGREEQAKLVRWDPPPYIKVPEEKVAMNDLVANLVGEHVEDPSRFMFINVHTLGKNVRRSNIFVEPPFSDRESYPAPDLVLELMGRNAGFGARVHDENTFVANIGFFQQPDGRTLVQVAPYEWEGPVYRHEHAAHRNTVTELFGEQDPSLLVLRRINLLSINPDGSIVTYRPHNNRPFGVDFVGVFSEFPALPSLLPNTTISLKPSGGSRE